MIVLDATLLITKDLKPSEIASKNSLSNWFTFSLSKIESVVFVCSKLNLCAPLPFIITFGFVWYKLILYFSLLLDCF